MNHNQQFQDRPAHKAPRGLKTLAGAIALAMLTALPAMAEVINFDQQLPTAYAGGETFVDSGYQLLVQDSPYAIANGWTGGAAGAIINGADVNSCDVIACPGGNASNAFLGLNDGSVKLSRLDAHAFRISSLDYAFVAPVGGLSNAVYGQLVLTGQLAGGGTISTALDFPTQNANGDFAFSNAALNSVFSHANLSGLTISACLFDGNGSCFNSADFPAMNQAQFGIDNLNVSAVPEPSAYLMMGLGLAGLGLARRRAKAAAAKSI